MRLKSKQGFTLLEVIMILAIIVVSGMILMPVSSGFMKQFNEEAEAQKVRMKIREIQQLAITRQAVYSITFDDFTGNSYLLSYDSTGDGIPDTNMGRIYLDNNISMVSAGWSPTNRVDFDHFGAPQAAGFVQLQNSLGESIYVRVQATGKVSIEHI